MPIIPRVLTPADLDGVMTGLLPVPVAVAPGMPVPESGATAWDLLPGEIRRILAYTDAGWVASPGELREYLAWLWRQPQLSTCAAAGPGP